MFKQLLQAIIDRIKPCQHDWQFDYLYCTSKTRVVSDFFPTETAKYRCTKCCKSKKIKS